MVLLCLSTFQSRPTGTAETGEGGSRDDPGCPRLADGGVVPTAPTSSHPPTSSTPQREVHPSTDAQTNSSPPTQEDVSTGGKALREAMQARGFQGKTVEIMCASWRPNTKKQYNCYVLKWKKFCAARSHNPLCTTVKVVLEFLTQLFEEGLGYNSINTARSALSAFTQCEDLRSVASHPHVIRFMKGVFELRTPQPCYQQTWDVKKLL